MTNALARLQEGNARYVSGERQRSLVPAAAYRSDLVSGQAPFAAILGCSDSRVPAEIVFDAGLGDLFVIRVAGNVAAESQIGSVEFAVERLGTRLVVVLGHTHCGAVRATLDQLRSPQDGSPNLGSILQRIQPALEPLLASAGDDGDVDLMRRAVRANVSASAAQLRAEPRLQPLVESGELMIVGGLYSLETGAVEFFDRGA